MYTNEDYDSEVKNILTQARQKESDWLKADPEKKSIARQFPSPIQPYQQNWPNSPPLDTVIPKHPPCPRCQSGQFNLQRVLDGVRHNGDGYGTYYESCEQCGWTVFWYYDEAD